MGREQLKAVVDTEELEAFLNYLADKADDVYEREVQQEVDWFLQEQVTDL